jgi:undecaprenyl-diphosphatase
MKLNRFAKRMPRKSLVLARRLIRWVGGIEPAMLSLLILIAFAVSAFVAITGEVLEGDTQAIDEWLLLRLRQTDALDQPIGPAWMQEMGRDFTALGGMAWLMLSTLGIAGFLASTGSHTWPCF